ncbi:VanZ family protein [Arthrobacter sp. NPDC058288]|uniref:VanZ family protein n=1 Tax=Arthrobacter sp. NPDC058288 TaxID=3346424 RepID=UPI0036E68D6F
MKRLEQSWFWRAVLAAMLVPLALLAFWPSPVDKPVQGELAGFLILIHALGIPAWINYAFIEATANVVLFVTVGLVASQGFPNKRIWQLGAFGLVVSGCMELGQQLFLHDRFASPLDLVTNTAGCVIGAVAARVGLRELKRRQAHRQMTMSLPQNSL